MSWLFFLIIILDIIYLIIFLIQGFFCRYNPYSFRKKYSTGSVKKMSGKASIFIPCKGVYPLFEKNIRNFLKLKNENLRIFFIVENKEDPAYEVIKQNIQGNDHAFVVEAGAAVTCSQKNHNLIKGIKASGQSDDFYIFLDSDTLFSLEKLKILMGPLSDPAIDTTFGFQWNILKRKNLGDRFMSFLIGTQWLNLNIPFIKWLWGGAWAIKRKTFEELNVSDYWSKRAVDDISLAPLLQKNKKKTCFVPIAINERHQGVTSVKQALQWYKRQYLYLKFYTYSIWLFGLLSLSFMFGQIWLLPFAIAGAVFFNSSLILPLLLYTLFVLCIIMIGASLMKRPCRDNFSLISWILLSPVFSALSLISILATLFTWKMLWSRVLYRINRRGIVINIKRKSTTP